MYRVLGFLAGSVTAGTLVYFYILQEYRTANEMLSEDIYVCSPPFLADVLRASAFRRHSWIEGVQSFGPFFSTYSFHSLAISSCPCRSARLTSAPALWNTGTPIGHATTPVLRCGARNQGGRTAKEEVTCITIRLYFHLIFSLLFCFGSHFSSVLIELT